MSSASDYQQARAATASAKDDLAALNARVESGDTKVTGSALASAKEDLALAERFEAGALVRAQQEQADAEAAAQEQAIADLLDGYRERTSSKLPSLIENFRRAAADLLTGFEDHRTTTLNAFAATRLPPRSGVPGYGHLDTPAPEQVLEGAIELTYSDVGMRSTSLYPHLAIEPIKPFLPVGVTA